MRKPEIQWIAIFIGFAITSLAGADGRDRPNIVLIVADDLGYGDLGCYGANDVRTPQLDRLASQGIRLTQFYANGPECSPTRTALLTGRYQQRVGGLECAIGTGNHGRYDDAIRLRDQHQLGLPVAAAEIPGRLKEAGYVCGMFGKWHLGYEPHFNPIEYGWDRFVGPLGGGVDYFHHTEPLGKFLGDDLTGEEMLFENRQRVDREGYLTDLITTSAIEWLGSLPTDQPFLLYVPYTAPHTPLQGPNDYSPQKQRGETWNEGTKETYVEMIEAMDNGIGKILEALDQRQLSNNTLVIFFSDNGPTPLGNTAGLKGTKGNVYEGGIKVPCILRYPDHIKPGQTNGDLFISMDLTASILRVAGTEPDRPLDGIDLVKAIASGSKPQPRALFWRKRRGEVTVKAVREGNWKLVVQQDGEQLTHELFALDFDPAESNNILHKRPKVAQRLKNRLTQWESEVAPNR